MILVAGFSVNSCSGMNNVKEIIKVVNNTVNVEQTLKNAEKGVNLADKASTSIVNFVEKVKTALTSNTTLQKNTDIKIEQERKKVAIKKEEIENQKKEIENQIESKKVKRDDMSKTLAIILGALVSGGAILSSVVFVVLLIIVAAIILAIGSVLGSILLYKWLKKRMEISQIIEKTSLKSFSITETVKQIFATAKKIFVDKKLVDLNAWHRFLVYAPETMKELNAMVYRVALCKQLGQKLPVVGFFGTPGAGKTVFAQNVFTAPNMLGMDFIQINGADIRKNEIGEAIKQIDSAIKRAMLSPNHVAIIIDEADGILQPGDKFSDQFMSYFLKVLEDEKITKHVMFVYTTNKKDIAPAVLSRTAFKVEVTQPGKSELSKLLALYLNKYVIEGRQDEDIMALNATGIFKQIDVKLDSHIMDKEFMEEVTEKLAAANASGRTIDQLCRYLAVDGSASADKTVTPEMVRAAVEKLVKDKDYFDKQDTSKKTSAPQQQPIFFMPVMMQPGMQQPMMMPIRA